MPIGAFFWVLFVVAFIFGGFLGFRSGPENRWYAGVGLVAWILIGLLGWAVFGPVLQ